MLSVPDLIGMRLGEACAALATCNLEPLNADWNGDLIELSPPGSVVVYQDPEPGADLPRTYRVRIRVEPEGPTGVREPRRPRPVQGRASGAVDEQTGESIG